MHSNSRDNFADQYYRMNVQKVTLVVEPRRPKLAIQRSGANAVISWPAAFEGFTLEGSEAGASLAWEAVASTNPTTVVAGNTAQLFRLRRSLSGSAGAKQ